MFCFGQKQNGFFKVQSGCVFLSATATGCNNIVYTISKLQNNKYGHIASFNIYFHCRQEHAI